MPYDLFWYGCPSLYFTYEDAYRDKIKIQDTLNWQNGVYMKQAIASSLSKDCKYPEKPLFAGAPEEEKTQNEDDMLNKFLILADAVNQKFK